MFFGGQSPDDSEDSEPGCGVEVHDLIILCTPLPTTMSDNDRKQDKLNVNRLIDFENLSTKNNTFTDTLHFERCIFIGNQNDNYFRYPHIYINKNETNSIRFTKCKLRNIVVNIQERTKFVKSNDNTMRRVNKLCGNITLDRVTTIFSGGFYLYESNIGESSKFDRYMTKITIKNSILHRAIIQPNFLTMAGSNRIELCEFIELQKKRFLRANGSVSEAKRWSEQIQPNISWNTYKHIYPAQEDWKKFKFFLIGLLGSCERDNDVDQADIFKREIIRCNHKLKWQDPFWKALPDLIPLEFNKWISSYGISWMRPLCVILIMNLLVCAYVFTSVNGIIISINNTILLYLQLLNPLTTFDNVAIQADDMSKSIMLPESLRLGFTALHTAQKIIFAICTYEMIRAARRFTRQYS